MPLHYDAVHRFRLPTVEQAYSARDQMLYAIGIGYGQDPLAEEDLPFVFEKHLKPSATFALNLGFVSLRNFDLGIDYTKVVHGMQKLELHAAMPSEGTAVCETVIEDVWDLGPTKGALLNIVRRVTDKASGVLVATASMGAFCRADGGFGGSPPPAQEAGRPAGPPAHMAEWRTLPNQALLFRLNGDYNALHADPDVAARAGFPRPILHGLCGFGAAGRVLVAALAGQDPTRLQSMQARFTAPFFPGETLRTEVWVGNGGDAWFRCLAVERDTEVIGLGRARLRPPMQ